VLTVVKLVVKLIIKFGFWSGLFGGGAAESYDRWVWSGDMVLPLVGLSDLDKTGSSCKVSLIAVFWERRLGKRGVALRTEKRKSLHSKGSQAALLRLKRFLCRLR
jgi:hypothetical protein